MRLNPAHFNRFLANIGQQFLWRPATACPCVEPGSLAPQPNCPHCLGKGQIWGAAIEAGAASSGQKTQVTWAKMGQYEAGDIVLTVPENSPLWDAGQFDRVTMLNATDKFSQVLKRGSPGDRLLVVPKEITRVTWIDKATQAIVDGGIPTWDANGRLTWAQGEPPPGMNYTITGTRLSEYFIYMDLPRNRNMHDGARLPKMTVLRRWDLLGRR